MRRLTLLLLFVVTTINMMCAQVPQGFTYQAIVRNNDGTTIANSQVSVRIELVHGSANGTVQYAENHSPLTDANGLFTIVIGDGVPLVNCLFSDCINWAVGPWFLTTRIDPTGGNSYTLVTTQQLMSVPYALYAANAGSAVQIRDSVVVYIRDSIAVRLTENIHFINVSAVLIILQYTLGDPADPLVDHLLVGHQLSTPFGHGPDALTRFRYLSILLPYYTWKNRTWIWSDLALRLAERAAAPHAGCPQGGTYLSARRFAPPIRQRSN